jgi:tRNA(fMet)-specific endonuclease VapC
MKFLLDTNTCIVYMKGKNLSLKRRLESTLIQDIFVCSVVKAELFYGAMKSINPQGNLAHQRSFLSQFQSLPFDDIATLIFATIRSQLEASGTPIGAYDLQIAAIALANDLTLVTHNVREFSRVADLKVEDWERDV